MAKPKGGLTEWFKQDWVDIGSRKKGGGFAKCGRSKLEKDRKRKYPKCVPAAKAARMSDKEIKSAVRRKRAKKQGVGGKPTNVKTFARDGGAIMAGRTGRTPAKPSARKRYEKLSPKEKSVVNKILRVDTGATINSNELKFVMDTYFPALGDTAETKANKAKARQKIINQKNGGRSMPGHTKKKKPMMANKGGTVKKKGPGMNKGGTVKKKGPGMNKGGTVKKKGPGMNKGGTVKKKGPGMNKGGTIKKVAPGMRMGGAVKKPSNKNSGLFGRR